MKITSTKTKKNIFFLIILCATIFYNIFLNSDIFCAPTYLDTDCLGCHVFGKAININLTHPNLLQGCITCHSLENLGFHKNGIKELDPLFYNYLGSIANTGCGICHGEPPFSLCGTWAIPDHCLSPEGCAPGIFNCVLCHLNFNGLPSHIYPISTLYIPFSSNADTSRCLLCHGLALVDLLNGSHKKIIFSPLMAKADTSSLFSIDCFVCHPPLNLNLGTDHLSCIPGLSNANLYGRLPVIFNPLITPVLIGTQNIYIPDPFPPVDQLGRPLGGTGTCIVYCHSDGKSLNPPISWSTTFVFDPLIGNCKCCHGFPPQTHKGNSIVCDKCHPVPALSLAANNLSHINGIIDYFRQSAIQNNSISLSDPLAALVSSKEFPSTVPLSLVLTRDNNIPLNLFGDNFNSLITPLERSIWPEVNKYNFISQAMTLANLFFQFPNRDFNLNPAGWNIAPGLFITPIPLDIKTSFIPNENPFIFF